MHFVKVLYLFVNFVLWRLPFLTLWPPLQHVLHAVVLEGQSYLALWSRLGWGNLFSISGGIEKKLWEFSEGTDSEFAEFLLHRRRWGLLLDSYNTTCHIKFIFLSCSCRYVSPVCIRSWFPSFPFQIKHHSWISRGKFTITQVSKFCSLL